MPKVKFSSYSSKHNAGPGDVKEVPEQDAINLEDGGIAVPATKADAKEMGVDPDIAASVKK